MMPRAPNARSGRRGDPQIQADFPFIGHNPPGFDDGVDLSLDLSRGFPQNTITHQPTGIYPIGNPVQALNGVSIPGLYEGNILETVNHVNEINGHLGGMVGIGDQSVSASGFEHDDVLYDDDFSNDFDGEGDEDDDTRVGGNQKDPSAKKKKQLARNRETAKRCRKRKRERADALMDEVNRLRETNKQLEIQLKIANSKLGKTSTGRGNRGIEEEQRRQAEMQRIAQMVQQRCSEKEIAIRMMSYQELYSDFGEERRKVLRTHIQQLEKLVLPTKISKMLLWILEQKDEFFALSHEALEAQEKAQQDAIANGNTSLAGPIEAESPKSNVSIWNTLVTELKIDATQKELFLSLRSKLGSQNDGIKNIVRKLKGLENEILKCMDNRKAIMEIITSSITPSQQAKFMEWVEKNEACVHLLDNLWKKRTSALNHSESMASEAPSVFIDDIIKTE